MSPLRKTGAFAAALTAAFAAAYGVGSAVAPVDGGRAQETAHASMADDDGHAAQEPTTAHAPAGLQATENGYTLDLETNSLPAGARTTLRFVVRDAEGAPVTAYRTEHGKQLHLIVASRELTAYRHLHPTRAADGTWSTPVELPEAGGYRVFADFTPAAAKEGLTLGSDLAVTGRYATHTLPAPASTATVDGYTVRLHGAPAPGRESDLTFTVSRAGRPVTTLQPYLGAHGHLVALRSGDLAYLHVHPHEEAKGTTPSGPEVTFTATTPTPGTYRLFLDFKVADKVHTAAFTTTTTGQGH
ncbi:hypothetical protein ACIP3D_16335 [Streptomyces longwoodensis]|uniref:hypothetical protein n=1 Tax=Streptomyces longwoodensis TaxID=68231 RepID=UPI0037F4E6BF